MPVDYGTIKQNNAVRRFTNSFIVISGENHVRGDSARRKTAFQRKLSAHLGISQMTVQNAYAQLVAEGYLRAQPKSGYYAEQIGPLPALEPEPSPTPAIFPEPPAFDMPFRPMRLTQTPSRSLPGHSTHAGYSVGTPISSMPPIRRASTRCGNKSRIIYIISVGSVQHRSTSFSAPVPEYLFAILIQLLGRDSLFALENPGYRKIGRILQDHDVRTVPIALDESGMRLSSLRESGANIAHVSPSHQFPSGIVMPVSRRLALLKWAEETPGRYIIESDYDSEFRFSGNPLPACRSLQGRRTGHLPQHLHQKPRTVPAHQLYASAYCATFSISQPIHALCMHRAQL